MPDSEFQVVFNTLLFGDPLSLNRWSWPLPIMSLTADPFEDLAMLPVPPRTVPFAQRDGQNLQSLLSATVAMPNK